MSLFEAILMAYVAENQDQHSILWAFLGAILIELLRWLRRRLRAEQKKNREEK